MIGESSFCFLIFLLIIRIFVLIQLYFYQKLYLSPGNFFSNAIMRKYAGNFRPKQSFWKIMKRQHLRSPQNMTVCPRANSHIPRNMTLCPPDILISLTKIKNIKWLGSLCFEGCLGVLKSVFWIPWFYTKTTTLFGHFLEKKARLPSP